MNFKVNRTSRLGDDTVAPCGGAFQNFKDSEWFININSLENLLEFIKKEGSIVIDYNPDVLEIEIYDTYRE